MALLESVDAFFSYIEELRSRAERNDPSLDRPSTKKHFHFEKLYYEFLISTPELNSEFKTEKPVAATIEADIISYKLHIRIVENNESEEFFIDLKKSSLEIVTSGAKRYLHIDLHHGNRIIIGEF